MKLSIGVVTYFGLRFGEILLVELAFTRHMAAVVAWFDHLTSSSSSSLLKRDTQGSGSGRGHLLALMVRRKQLETV